MAGIEFFTTYNPGRTEIALDRLIAADRDELLESLAALGESQTKRRISSEKESPSGEAWADWSDSYSNTRNSGQSLLMGEGNLLDSIAAGNPSGGEISWGSNEDYAAVHQFGHTFDNAFGRGIEATIPARPYLGLSDDNEREMEMVALAFIRETMQ